MPTDTAASRVLQAFYDWWTAPGRGGSVENLFDAEFVYDGGFERLGREDYVWWVEQAPQWTELRLLDDVVSEEKCALIFEGTDGTTGLRYRVCWVIEVRNGKLLKLLQATENIHQSSQNSSR